MEIELITHKWEDINVNEISQVAFASIQSVINQHNNHPSGFNKENLTLKNVEQWLRNLQDRFPASVFIFAYLGNKLVGWLSIEVSDTGAELGRWHPYVDPNYNEKEIASKLIHQCIEYIRKAAKLAAIGVEAGVEAIKPGVKEFEVAAEIEYAMRVKGSEGPSFRTVVASGQLAS